MSVGGVVSVSLAFSSAASGSAAGGAGATATAGTAGSGSSGSAGDTTSVIKYPDGSTVTTVRNKEGQVVSITVTEPAASAAATPATTAGSAIDISV